jgi:hypothetical protein
MYLLDIVYERHRRHSSLSGEGRGVLSVASDDRLHSGRNKVAAPDSLSWGWHSRVKARTGHLTLLGVMKALKDRLAVP